MTRSVRTPPIGEDRAFLWAHGALLGIVLVGFARTFYLHSWFAQNRLDALLLAHGVSLTAWFALAFAQALLIGRRQRHWHGRLAWLAAIVVPALVMTSAWVNTRVALRIESASDPENMFVWGNYVSLVAFATLVATAVAQRRRPEIHRRLLLLASVAIVGPAFARFAFWPVFGMGLAGAPLFAIGGMLALLAAAISYDLRARGRVHGATIGGVTLIIATLLLAVAVAQSGVAFELVRPDGGANHAPARAD